MRNPGDREESETAPTGSVTPYPTPDDEAGAGRAPRSGTRRRGPVIAICLVVVLVALVIVLHMTGVIGPGLHGGSH